jgi:hypothetical protein
VGMLYQYQKNGPGFTTKQLVWEIPGWTKRKRHKVRMWVLRCPGCLGMSFTLD